MATLNEVERAAEEGDQVTFNVITVEGDNEDVVTPYLTARLGKGEVSTEFETALVGSRVGDKVPVAAVTEPETTEDEEAQPDTKSTVLEILAIRELVLPELDADFVGQVSEFSTVEELREDVRTSMATRRVSEARSLFEQQLYQKVLELTEPKTVPEALLNSAYQQELHDFGHALDGSGISLRRYLEMSQQDENALAGQLSSKAAQSVLWDLALRAIAIDEAVSVDPAEVHTEIERLAASGALEGRPESISPLQEFQVRTTLIKQKAYQRLANIVTLRDVDGGEVTLSQIGLDQLVEAGPDVEPEPVVVPEQ
jgi:trigger factor